MRFILVCENQEGIGVIRRFSARIAHQADNVLRKFNRDTHLVAVGLWGILLLGAWACLVLMQKHRPPKSGLTETISQAKSDSSPTAEADTFFTEKELNTNRSLGAETSVKSLPADPKATEPSSKESLGWAEIAGGSTPSPVLVLTPESSHPEDGPNERDSLSSYQPNSARIFRRTAPHQSPRSARQLGDAEAKRRLLELWHRSLAKSAGKKEP
jgi:hypothetical protein